MLLLPQGGAPSAVSEYRPRGEGTIAWLLAAGALAGCGESGGGRDSGSGNRYAAKDVASNLEEGTIFQGVDSVEQLDTRCEEASGDGFDCSVKAPQEERRYRVSVDQDGAWAGVQTPPDRGGDGTFGCCIEPAK